MFEYDFPYNPESFSTDEDDWTMFVQLTNRGRVRVGNATYPKLLEPLAYGDDNVTPLDDTDKIEGQLLCEFQTDTTAERVLTTQ